MKTPTELYAQLCAEEISLRDKLRLIAVQKLTLEQVGANGTETSRPPVSIRQPKVKHRAPPGALPAAILSVLGGKGSKPLGNAAIRERIRSTGYRWSLEPIHVSKTLTQLSQQKKIVGKGSKTARVYIVKS